MTIRRSADSMLTRTSSAVPPLTTTCWGETRALFTTTARIASSAACVAGTARRSAVNTTRASTPAVYQGDTVICTLSV